MIFSGRIATAFIPDTGYRIPDTGYRKRATYPRVPCASAQRTRCENSYGNRHADLLFEIVSRRYEVRPTIITTNRPFTEWNEVFPNAACVISIIDRLIHHSEILVLEGESYRFREAKERTSRKKQTTAAKPTAPSQQDEPGSRG